MAKLKKTHAAGIIAILIVIIGLTYSRKAHAEAYVGVTAGAAIGSGTAVPLNTGYELGATTGVQLLPEFGIALTYLHDSLGATNLNATENISQVMAEANMFSYLILHGGLHVGDVITNAFGNTSADLGFGFQVGFDVHLTERLSTGLTGYYTYVTEANDKHSLINLMIPLKVWF